jgi:hypothetical protein
MHLSIMVRGAAVLAALSGTAAATGIGMTRFKRDLKLSAELGINPDTLISQKTTVHSVATAQLDSIIKAEYASVCDFILSIGRRTYANTL